MNRDSKFLKLAAGVGLLLSLTRSLLTPSEKAEANSREEGAQRKSGQAERHSGPAALPSPEAERPEGQDGAKTPGREVAKPKKPRWTYKRWQTVLTGAITFATVVSVVVAFFQWQALREQTGLMSRTLDEAKLTRQVENRPYMVLTSYELDSPINSVGSYLLTITFTNSGKTPAYRTSISQYKWIAPTPIPDFERAVPPGSRREPYPLPKGEIAAPGGVLKTSIKIDIEEEEFTRITARHERLYVFGTLLYTDVVRTPPGFTEHFCFLRLGSGVLTTCKATDYD